METLKNELLTRGVENVIPRDLAQEKLASKEPLRIYFGIDPTGAKLHLGHSVPLRKLKAFGDAGHHIIFVVGSFTAMIGDPSNRDTLREPLTKAQVEENFKDYKKQAEKILDLSKVEVRYNHEWLEPLVFSDIINLASKFTVQQMLQRDMFDKRLKEGKPVGLHEFLYPLMVGYDSVVLDVDCELGGSDQEFNMLAGRQLQKNFGKRDKFILTTKLIEGTDGRKMSKTYDNCIYLEDKPNDMYGKVMSMVDAQVTTYFELCTNLSMTEVSQISTDLEEGKLHPKDAKMRLAREIVTLYHGEKMAEKAEEDFIKTFSKKGIPEDAPLVQVPLGTKLVDVLLDQKIIESKSEWRRLVEEGAISNAETEENVKSGDQAVDKNIILKVGKRRFIKIEIL
ncbi:MAG: tyrosine--tRNA ligase [Minisyncoccota bacterium]